MDSSLDFSQSLKPDPSLPLVYWNQLTEEDKNEFIKLRTTLHQSQKSPNSMKDSRLMAFSNEMKTILKFIEHDETGRQQRSILTGVAFAGAFICVNTRQLKNFLGRCKSSINGSLQQLGYMAVRTKSKARSCVLAVMPLLSSDSNLLRQWTVRGASEDALFCFVSNFQPNPMPNITSDDLNEDRKTASAIKVANAMLNGSIPLLPKEANKPHSSNHRATSSKTKATNSNSSNFQTPQQAIQNIIKHVLLNVPQQKLNILNSINNTNSIDLDYSAPVTDFKSPDMFNYSSNYDLKPFEMAPSFSVDYLHKFGDSNDYLENDILIDYENEWSIQSHRTVPRSHSAFFSPYDWKIMDDPQMFF